MPRTKNGTFELHTLSYLKRITGDRTQELQVNHVLALAPRDAKRLKLTHKRNEFEHRLGSGGFPFDMRGWRPKDGWSISRTDTRWLDIPDEYVIVYTAGWFNNEVVEQV